MKQKGRELPKGVDRVQDSNDLAAIPWNQPQLAPPWLRETSYKVSEINQKIGFSDVIVRNHQRIIHMVGPVVVLTQSCKWLSSEKPREEILLLEGKGKAKIWKEGDSNTVKTRLCVNSMVD